MKNIGLIGFGRFGQLLQKHLQRRSEIAVWDPSQAGSPSHRNVNFRSLESVCDRSLLILAVPVSALEKVVRQIAPFVGPETIVMDVCAVKLYPLRIMSEVFPKEIEILGTHPLFGPDSARETMQGHQMIIVPERISLSRLDVIKKFWSQWEIELVEMSAEEHDRLMAQTLALTHFLGRALNEMDLPLSPHTTQDYRNLMKLKEKINRDTFELFEDMHRYNPFAQEMRELLLNSIAAMKAQLDSLEPPNQVSVKIQER